MLQYQIIESSLQIFSMCLIWKKYCFPSNNISIIQNFLLCVKIITQSVVGQLNWLYLSTRPDITTITNTIFQYLYSATTSHVTTTKCVVKYLKSYSSLRILFSGERLKYLIQISQILDDLLLRNKFTSESTTIYNDKSACVT